MNANDLARATGSVSVTVINERRDPNTGNLIRLASDKQRVFVEKLLSEKDTAGTKYEGWTPDWSKATGKAASGVIDFLLTLPRKAQAAAEEIKAGVYQNEGTLFRVYLGQQSGKMLVAMVEVEEGEATYEYLGAASRVLPATAVRLPLEEVGKLGITSGSCLVCSRHLDVPESVDRGIGPVCFEKY